MATSIFVFPQLLSSLSLLSRILASLTFLFIIYVGLRIYSNRTPLRRLSFSKLPGPGAATPPLKGTRRGSVYDECPNTTRTDAEIASFGRFPDYAALSEVPLPKPYSEFDVTKALPRPYRPFRWSYHQTMSFKKLEPDWWIELENTYIERLAQRQALFREHGPEVLQMLPGMNPACRELMEMVLQFLVARYPHYFSLETTSASPDGQPDVFVNRILNVRENLLQVPPLEVLLNHVPEDFAIVKRNELTGEYEFRAGVICSALGWNVQTKIGKTLREIHGIVPDYAEKMAKSMDRFFSKMPASSPIQRGSWGLEYEQPLFLPPGHPHLLHRLTQSPIPLSSIYLRVDWQTLRRLPLSGCIVFNFKALFTPILQVRDEPKIPALIVKVLKEGNKEIMEYKGTWHVEHVTLPALETWADEQVKSGVVEDGWKVETVDEYPLFEGWEGKWRRQQGF